jgi:hypothetical protein
MSIGMLERAADEPTSFLDEVAFVGGATVALWITDPGAPEPRPTKDVEIVDAWPGTTSRIACAPRACATTPRVR